MPLAPSRLDLLHCCRLCLISIPLSTAARDHVPITKALARGVRAAMGKVWRHRMAYEEAALEGRRVLRERRDGGVRIDAHAAPRETPSHLPVRPFEGDVQGDQLRRCFG